MAQRIIMIHGRSTKPARVRHVAFWKAALAEGVRRADPAKALAMVERIRARDLAVDVVYYGDILNGILAGTSAKHRKGLTETDADFGGAACLPPLDIQAAIEALFAIKRYNRASYRKVIAGSDHTNIQDEMALFFSLVAGLATLGVANQLVIGNALADLRDYFRQHDTGSAIRARLHAVLDPAIKRGDDICLIAHSMGCMVSYDAMWKISRRSEFDKVRAGGGKVNRWITIGCPLGEIGIQRNLIDRGEFGRGKYPKDIIGTWLNIAARDDFVAHEKKMKTEDNYLPMLKLGLLDDIRDLRSFNCYAEAGKPNPHKAFGYLADPVLGKAVAAWLG